MNDYKALIANCLVHGEEFTVLNNYKIRNKINLKLGNKNIELYQSKDVIIHNLRKNIIGKWFPTTELIIKNINKNNIKSAFNISKDVSSLLTFACNSIVTNYGYKYPSNTNNGCTYSTMGFCDYHRPSIEINDGLEVKKFIEKTWKNFRKFNKSRKLSIVFRYIVLAQYEQLPIESKLITMFIILELLKTTYAKSKKIPFIKDRFKKPNKSNYSFEELLKMMLKDCKITIGIKRIIKARNKIIHSGTLYNKFESNIKIFEKCNELVRIYIIKLLNYDGNYFSYSNPNKILKSI